MDVVIRVMANADEVRDKHRERTSRAYQPASSCTYRSLGASEGKKALDRQVDISAALLEYLQVGSFVGEAHLL